MSLSAMFTLFLSNGMPMKASSIRGRAGRATVTVDSDEVYVEIHISAEDIGGAERLIMRLQEAIAIAKQTEEGAA